MDKVNNLKLKFWTSLVDSQEFFFKYITNSWLDCLIAKLLIFYYKKTHNFRYNLILSLDKYT